MKNAYLEIMFLVIGNIAIIHVLLRIVYNVMRVIIHNVYYVKADIMSIITMCVPNAVFRIAKFVMVLDVWPVFLGSHLMQEEINVLRFNANQLLY